MTENRILFMVLLASARGPVRPFCALLSFTQSPKLKGEGGGVSLPGGYRPPIPVASSVKLVTGPAGFEVNN